MNEVRLVDACFAGCPSSIAGDNAQRSPEHFEWCRGECKSRHTFITNWSLREAEDYPRPRVAWLLEPPAMWKWPYEYIWKRHKAFDVVLTYDRTLLSLGDKRIRFCPHGGSWINWDEWGIHKKSREVCMFVSDKINTMGQELRHEVAREFDAIVDIYGAGVGSWVPRKADILKHYRYCIVVESVKMDYYFSEKLIDPLSVGTVPIYFGCPGIGRFFDREGILAFNNTDQLGRILCWIGQDDYRARRRAIFENLERAREYRMAENWAYEHYPELFS